MMDVTVLQTIRTLLATALPLTVGQEMPSATWVQGVHPLLLADTQQTRYELEDLALVLDRQYE